MIFCIILMAIAWVFAILFFIASIKDEDCLIASFFCIMVFIITLMFSVFGRASAKVETRKIKAIIENPECYTCEDIESSNRHLLNIQSSQDTIFSFHYNDDELRNLKPIILPSNNDTSKFIKEQGNIEKK